MTTIAELTILQLWLNILAQSQVGPPNSLGYCYHPIYDITCDDHIGIDDVVEIAEHKLFPFLCYPHISVDTPGPLLLKSSIFIPQIITVIPSSPARKKSFFRLLSSSPVKQNYY